MFSSGDLVFVFDWDGGDDGGRSSVDVDEFIVACSENDDKGGWRRLFEFETKVAVDEDAGKAICCDGKTAEPPLLLLDVDDDACNSSGSGEEEEGRFLINVDSSSSFILSSPVECNNTDDGGGPFSSSLFPALFDMIVFDSF